MLIFGFCIIQFPFSFCKMETETERHSRMLTDMPDLVIEKILQNLNNFEDLKRFRLVCSLTNKWVLESVTFSSREYFMSISHTARFQALSPIFDCLEIPLKELHLNIFDLQTDDSEFLRFLEKFGESVETLRIEIYPFQTPNLKFLVHFKHLKSLHFDGVCSFKGFISCTTTSDEDADGNGNLELIFKRIEELSLCLSCDGMKNPEEFLKFSEILMKFENLQRFITNCDVTSHQRLFQQIPVYLKRRFPGLIMETEDAIKKTATNSDSGLGKLFEFTINIDLDLELPKNKNPQPTDIETLLFSRILGIKTKRIGYNVDSTFPLHKLADNLTSLNIHMGKFDLFDLDLCKTEEERSFFPQLKKLGIKLPLNKPELMLSVAMVVFKGGRNKKKNFKLEELTIKFPKEVEFADKLKGAEYSATIRDRTRGFLLQNPNLKRLGIRNGCFDEQWLKELGNLKRLELIDIHDVKMLDEMEDCQIHPALTHLKIVNTSPHKERDGYGWIDSFLERNNLKPTSDKLEGFTSNSFHFHERF